MAWIYKLGVGKYLRETERENNATEFYNYFSNYGATIEAICGMLGNIEQESTINPAVKQSNSTSSGWGLIQWKPSTLLTNWCKKYGYNWYDGNAQCVRIIAEGEKTMGASGYWIPTSNYPYSWDEFITLDDVEECVYAYLYERERAGVSAIQNRLEYANKWYTYFSGVAPHPPTPPTPLEKSHRLPVYMMIKNF